MANQVERNDVVRFLERSGFSRRDGRHGHLQFTNGQTLVTIPGHGPKDLTKKHVGQIVRTLVRGGFDRETILRGMRGEI